MNASTIFLSYRPKPYETHGDLWVESPLLGFKELFDSYYIVISTQLQVVNSPLKEKPTHLTLQLKKDKICNYLQNWIYHISQMRRGDCLYLPFGLADQFSYAFQVAYTEEDVELSVVCTRIEGYVVDLIEIKAYQPMADALFFRKGPVKINLESLTKDILKSIEEINNILEDSSGLN